MKKAFASPVHVGELVRKVLDEKGIKHKSVYEKLGYTKSSFSLLLTKPVWDVGMISEISKEVGVNLFAYFVNGEEYQTMVMEDSPVYMAKSLDTELTKCRESLIKEKKYSQSLSDNVDYLKKHNRELEIELNSLKKS